MNLSHRYRLVELFKNDLRDYLPVFKKSKIHEISEVCSINKEIFIVTNMSEVHHMHVDGICRLELIEYKNRKLAFGFTPLL